MRAAKYHLAAAAWCLRRPIAESSGVVPHLNNWELRDMSIPKFLGIDLGTTHTITAFVNASGHTEVLRMREGELLVPSVVLLGDERVVVGREARLRGRMHPERLAACVKRQIGQPYYDERLGGETFPPEVLQACLLNAIRREWCPDPVAKAGVVIAVPAHFNEAQRHATAIAAEIAGLSLVDLVNEPIAAALAFAEHTPILTTVEPFPSSGNGHRQAVLVYDLGGYTFEASLLWISPEHISLVATDHDSFLGGHDWDLRLVDFLAEPFIRKTNADPRTDPALLEQLVERAGQAKLALGVRKHTSVALSWRGQVEKQLITREWFEGMTADLVARTLAICDRVVQGAGLAWSDVNNVLLVGGTTRMPMIRQALAKHCGRPPDDRVCADEAVARGAALYAARIKAGQAGPPPLRISSFSTHSLGIEGTDQTTGERVNKVLIPQGTPLPATATREFMGKRVAGQGIAFNVLEGDHSVPSKCVTIGRVILKDLPPDMADRWPVEVKYEFSASGRLTVDARIRYTDRHVHLETVRPAGVSQTHIARWKEVVAAQGGLAAFCGVRAWERTADAPPPVILAGIEPPSPSAEETPAPGVWTFLERMLPFVFHRRTESAAESRVPSPRVSS
jgi:molecular chaperone DnaK